MRKNKRARHADGARTERESRQASADRIDRVMADRAAAGDRAFEEQLERWKRKGTKVRGNEAGRERR